MPAAIEAGSTLNTKFMSGSSAAMIARATATMARPTPMPTTPPSERGGDRVQGALDAERAHQVVALEPDRPQHAELGLALLGEHHEEVDEQQDAGDHAEGADAAEQLADALALRLGRLEQVVLDRLDLRGLEQGGVDGEALLDRPASPRRWSAPSKTPPSLETSSSPLGGSAGRAVDVGVQRADRPRRDEHAAVAGEPDAGQDVADGERAGLAVGEHLDLVAGADLELVGQLLADDGLVAGRGRAGVGQAGVAEVAAEPAGRVEVDLDDGRERLGRRARRRPTRPRRRSTRGQRAVGARHGAVATPRDHVVEQREVGDPHLLVDRPELGAGEVADRRVERVADDERGGDDGGAEHRADDDERRLGRRRSMLRNARRRKLGRRTRSYATGASSSATMTSGPMMS